MDILSVPGLCGGTMTNSTYARKLLYVTLDTVIDATVAFFQNNYRIWVGTFSGTAGDAFSGGSNFEQQWSASLNGMQFSTLDRDHDRFLMGSCAEENKCGWWFNR